MSEASITVNTIDATDCSLIKNKELHRIIVHIRTIEQENRDLREQLAHAQAGRKLAEELLANVPGEQRVERTWGALPLQVDGLGNNNV